MSRVLVVVVALLVCASFALSGTPFSQRIWQLHDYDMSHILHLIDIAPSYGVNGIQLSHDIIMDAHEILEDENRQRDFKKIIEEAHARGLKVTFWTHELAKVPEEFIGEDGRVDLDREELWLWFRTKYERVFSLLPNIDGVVLTFHETRYIVYDNGRVSSELPEEARVAKLINELASVCAKHGKKLYVRTFAYQPEELEFIKRGLLAVNADITVMSKCVPHDWQPYYPPNPLLGDVGGHPQIMEIDLGHEFTGKSLIPYCNVNYIKRMLDIAARRGVIGVVARVERHSYHPFGTPNEVDIYALSKLWLNLDYSLSSIWQEWAEQKYGKAAAPYVISALRRTEKIVNLTYFPLGAWVTTHSFIPSLNYAVSHLKNNYPAKWIPTPSWKRREYELNHPSEITIKKVLREKDIARRLVRASIADLERARTKMDEQKWEELYRYFDLLSDVVETYSLWQEMLLRYLRVENIPQGSFKEEFEAVRKLKEAMERAQEWADIIESKYGYDSNPCNAKKLKKFIEDIGNKLSEKGIKL